MTTVVGILTQQQPANEQVPTNASSPSSTTTAVMPYTQTRLATSILLENETRLVDTFQDIARRHVRYGRDQSAVGFDAEELYNKGALQLPQSIPREAQRSTLNDPILDIFEAKNWTAQGQEVYEFLEPGLRLASFLLTHKAASSYFHTLCCGKRENEYDRANSFLRTRIPSARTWSPSCQTHISKFIRDNVYTTWFSFSNTLGGPKAIADYTLRDFDGKNFIDIRLCTGYYASAKRLAKIQDPDPNTILRYNFSLAISLVHEMAHAFEQHRQSKQKDEATHDVEAHYGTNQWVEAGTAWEVSLFGGQLWAIGSAPDGRWGFSVYDTGELPTLDLPPNKASIDYFSVPMVYILKIQQSSWWARKGLTDGHFEIPRTGAVGYHAISIPELFVYETPEAAERDKAAIKYKNRFQIDSDEYSSEEDLEDDRHASNHEDTDTEKGSLDENRQGSSHTSRKSANPNDDSDAKMEEDDGSSDSDALISPTTSISSRLTTPSAEQALIVEDSEIKDVSSEDDQDSSGTYQD